MVQADTCKGLVYIDRLQICQTEGDNEGANTIAYSDTASVI